MEVDIYPDSNRNRNILILIAVVILFLFIISCCVIIIYIATQGGAGPGPNPNPQCNKNLCNAALQKYITGNNCFGPNVDIGPYVTYLRFSFTDVPDKVFPEGFLENMLLDARNAIDNL